MIVLFLVHDSCFKKISKFYTTVSVLCERMTILSKKQMYKLVYCSLFKKLHNFNI